MVHGIWIHKADRNIVSCIEGDIHFTQRAVAESYDHRVAECLPRRLAEMTVRQRMSDPRAVAETAARRQVGAVEVLP